MEKYSFGVQPVFRHFILDMYSQFTEAFNTDTLIVCVVAINCQKQICDQPGIHLHHKAIAASGDQIVKFQVVFPLSENRFDFPSEFICFSILGGDSSRRSVAIQ